MTWQKLLSLYLQHMHAAGRATGTIRVHTYYLHYIRQLQPAPIRVRTEHLEHFLANPRWSPETRKSARGVAVSFFRFAYLRGYLPANPARDLGSIRVPPGVARPAPDHVIRDAIADAPYREELMIRFAAFCGLRACEIARVHPDDYAADMLHIVGKGKRERVVPVHDLRLKIALQQADYYLFPGLTGGGHMSAGHVTKLVSAALPDPWTAHTLRHRFATVAYARTRDLIAVQALMGHSKPETTRRYIQLPSDALEMAVAAAAQLSA